MHISSSYQVEFSLLVLLICIIFQNYQLIWRNYVKNTDDTCSLTDLAVQLFTVLSLVCKFLFLFLLLLCAFKIYKKLYENFMNSKITRSSSILTLILQMFSTNSLVINYLTASLVFPHLPSNITFLQNYQILFYQLEIKTSFLLIFSRNI